MPDRNDAPMNTPLVSGVPGSSSSPTDVQSTKLTEYPTTLVAIPCMESIPTRFFESMLGLYRPSGTVVAIAKSSLVYDARNMLSQMAIEKGFERILWLDSDMVFGKNLFESFSADLDEGRRFVAGLAFTRKNPIKPVVYSDTGYNESEISGKRAAYSTCIEDYPKDTIFEVAATGLAGCMMETSVVREVFEAFGSPFSPEAGFGEDLSFCRRANRLGVKLWCDSRIKLGHIAQKVVWEKDYLDGLVL